MNIDDFYTIYAYANLYKSDTNTVDEISATDITLTFVCSHYPRDLIKHWKNIRKYHINFIEPGIYYIEGDFFPIQLLLTNQLTDAQNLWLHNLTDQIHDSATINTLIDEYEQHQDEKLYKSVMNIITQANAKKFEEVTIMCEALEEIFLKVHGERLKREQQEAVDKAVAAAVSEAVAEVSAEKDAYIRKLELQLGISTS